MSYEEKLAAWRVVANGAERDEHRFRGVGLAGEHRLAEERPAEADTVKPARKPVLGG